MDEVGSWELRKPKDFSMSSGFSLFFMVSPRDKDPKDIGLLTSKVGPYPRHGSFRVTTVKAHSHMAHLQFDTELCLLACFGRECPFVVRSTVIHESICGVVICWNF